MSTLEDRLAYTPTTCFEPFPFPQNWETHALLEAAGRSYYEFRARLLVNNDEGLTDTYNDFNDPEESAEEIQEFRKLHHAMDRAVLDSYSWNDIKTSCEFLLDYEIDEEEWGDKKKPWRYRWPDEIRDEVLARLLELNRQRALEEGQLLSDDAEAAARRQKNGTKKKREANSASGSAVPLFAIEKGDD